MCNYKIFDFKDEEEWLSGRMNGIVGTDARNGRNLMETGKQGKEEGGRAV